MKSENSPSNVDGESAAFRVTLIINLSCELHTVYTDIWRILLGGAYMKMRASLETLAAIEPRSSKVSLGAGGKTLSLTLPGYSFTVVVL